jgi:hypothetical protein
MRGRLDPNHARVIAGTDHNDEGLFASIQTMLESSRVRIKTDTVCVLYTHYSRAG